MSAAAPERIAVVGLACRFPGAQSPDELWRNLREGRETIRVFTDDELAAAGIGEAQRRDPRYVPAKGVLDDADAFDAGFFGVSPREAALMDPQQRVFLETAWSALEDAGYDPRRYDGRIGVFAGSILSMYLLRNLAPNREVMSAAGNFQIAVGNDPTFLATSTSYQLDLRGPSGRPARLPSWPCISPARASWPSRATWPWPAASRSISLPSAATATRTAASSLPTGTAARSTRPHKGPSRATARAWWC